MTIYTIEFKNVEGLGILRYDEKGGLVAMDISKMKIPAEHKYWFLGWLPYTLTDLETKKDTQRLKVTFKEVKSDLSFKAFWDTYGNKIGKKPRAEKLWDLLTEIERARALQAIPKYKFWLANNTGVTMLHPTTFLSQRRFENEFKV